MPQQREEAQEGLYSTRCAEAMSPGGREGFTGQKHSKIDLAL